MSDSLLQRYNDSLEPQICPTCNSANTHQFLTMWNCRDCFTVWNRQFISEGELFDDEPDMCTDFDEFAKQQQGGSRHE